MPKTASLTDWQKKLLEIRSNLTKKPNPKPFLGQKERIIEEITHISPTLVRKRKKVVIY